MDKTSRFGESFVGGVLNLHASGAAWQRASRARFFKVKFEGEALV